MTTVYRIPDCAQDMLERRECSCEEAIAFLGVTRSVGYKMAARYWRRVAPLAQRGPVSIEALKPRQDAETHAWTEIPCRGTMGDDSQRKVGRYVVRTDLLVPMCYPEVGWPWQQEG